MILSRAELLAALMAGVEVSATWPNGDRVWIRCAGGDLRGDRVISGIERLVLRGAPEAALQQFERALVARPDGFDGEPELRVSRPRGA